MCGIWDPTVEKMSLCCDVDSREELTCIQCTTGSTLNDILQDYPVLSSSDAQGVFCTQFQSGHTPISTCSLAPTRGLRVPDADMNQ